MLSGQTLTLKKPLSVEKQAQIEPFLGQQAKKTKAPARERPQVPQEDARKQRLERNKEAVDWLMQAFPQCFNPKAPLPLKVGIGKEVMEKWLYLSSLPYDSKIPARTAIRTAIGWYVRRGLYLAAFETATHRIDLDGKEAGEITEAEKEYARERAEIKKQRQVKREEKKEATALS